MERKQKKELAREIILGLSCIVMSAYGIFMGSILGNSGYICVLMAGIVMLIYFIYKIVCYGVDK